MKTILKSSYPCLVKGKNSYHEIDKNDLLEMADEDIIFVYPQCSGQIPFYINLVSPVENSNFSINFKILLQDLQNERRRFCG